MINDMFTFCSTLRVSVVRQCSIASQVLTIFEICIRAPVTLPFERMFRSKDVNRIYVVTFLGCVSKF